MTDIGHRETDALLAELEKRISREYAQAVAETQEKLEDYLRRSEKKDETWRLWVANGRRTEAEYKAWRESQIMMGERWEKLRNQLAEDYHNANVIARAMIRGDMPEAYAINHNFATYMIEKAGRVNTSYTLYSRETVERIVRDNPDLLPMPGQRKRQEFAAFDKYKAGEAVKLTEKQQSAFDKLIAGGRDIRWQEGQIQSATLQSILQGESIPHMAHRIADTMGETNHKASIRYARTAITGAQNAGRQDAYRRAEDMGIELKREWIATIDNRTRHAHRELDGQIRGVEEPFENEIGEIMFPGDPAADPENVWNCRCTLASVVSGWESKTAGLRSFKAVDDMSYEEWKEGHSKPRPI